MKFLIGNILSVKELLKKIVILVVFNGINYYKVFMRIFIKLERCRDKENRFARNFEYKKQKFL